MIKIGILSPSEIAFRRFLPALSKLNGFKFSGVAISHENEWNGTDFNFVREHNKANFFIEKYGGHIFNGYRQLIDSDEIDAVYLPLPPALHFYWAKEALKSGKHVLLEKPATTTLKESKELILLAEQNQLAVHENYMFVFHKQIHQINEFISSGVIGDVRLFRITFGFPQRNINDFRHSKELGGGAALDCGGYTLKYASLLLGNTTRVVCANVNRIKGFNVEMYGSATLINDEGLTAQVAFGMDNGYKCELEVWGSEGSLFSDRVLTAPVGFIPRLIITKDNIKMEHLLTEDDSFMKSISCFYDCVVNEIERKKNYNVVLQQAELLDQFFTLV